MAGLTFVFAKMMVEQNPDSASWIDNKSRGYLNSGDGWTKLPNTVQSAVATVMKRTNTMGDIYWSSNSAWSDFPERLFLTSSTEINVGREHIIQRYKLGVGKEKIDPYLIVSSSPAGCKSLNDIIQSRGWTRDYNEPSQQVFTQSFGGNSLGWLNPAPQTGYGYYPAFCM